MSLLFISALFIVSFSYIKSQTELTKAVDVGNISIAETVAAKINLINQREFKMLVSVTNMPLMKDENVDLREKWEFARNVTGKLISFYAIPVHSSSGKQIEEIGGQVDQFKV